MGQAVARDAVVDDGVPSSSFQFAFYCDWSLSAGPTFPSNVPEDIRGGDGSAGAPLLWETIQPVPPSPDIMHVVTGGDVPAGCPTARALRVRWRTTGEAKNVRKIVNVPDFSNLWHRFYAYVDGNWDAPHSMNHPHNIDVNELVPVIQTVMWKIGHSGADPAGTYRPGMTFAQHSDGGSQRFATPPMIAHEAWNRFEYYREIINQSPLHMRTWPHVYDTDGSLLYDADDFIMGHDAGMTLREWYEDEGHYQIVTGNGSTITAAQAARRFIFGNEDPDSASGPQRDYYFAAVAAALEKINDRLAA